MNTSASRTVSLSRASGARRRRRPGTSSHRATSSQRETVDQHPKIFARPGQALIWPGQFLLGEPRQSPNGLRTSGSAATNFPSWAARGSYLVCRRLNQNVTAFWNFVAEAASRVGVPPVTLAAALVGRWPSGAPVMRTPASDDAALAGDPSRTTISSSTTTHARPPCVRSPATQATPSPRPRQTCSAPSVPTSPTSAR